MTEQNTQAKQWRGPDPWSVMALVIAGVVVAPIVAVLWLALHPTENIWPHLLATVLPRYLRNTLVLMAGVGAVTATVGTGAAWLVVMHRFPGSRWLEHALLAPMAIPAYIGAYALVDFLDYAGPLQSGMRLAAGWKSSKDYWFPEVHSMGFAILVLAAAYYPYVYLLARAAFREMSGSTYEVAQALGTGRWGRFWRVGLPLARPAIAAGVALALMETVADVGTVQHFAVQTLTTGVYSVWFNGNNAGGAAQLSGVILALILTLLAVERQARNQARFHRPSRSARPVMPVDLHGVRAWAAAVCCGLPFTFGFVLPVAVMSDHALRKPQVWLMPGLGAAILNTLIVGGLAAVVTVTAALVLVHGVRLGGRSLARVVLPVTALGYAAPGAVLAVGILIPLAALDHRLADAVLAVTGHDPGLLLTGTAAALVLAYAVRFFGIAQSAVDSAFGRVSPMLPLAARSLGRTAGGVLRDVFLPLMRGSVSTALLVVFVECSKELPATLLLRPFNFNTLATRAYDLASLEKITEAAPAALLVIAVGLMAVAVLARTSRA